jgi:hypothetical protein
MSESPLRATRPALAVAAVALLLGAAAPARPGPGPGHPCVGYPGHAANVGDAKGIGGADGTGVGGTPDPGRDEVLPLGLGMVLSGVGLGYVGLRLRR